MKRIFKQVLNSIHSGYGTLIVLSEACDIDIETIKQAGNQLRAFGFAVEFDSNENMTVGLCPKENALESILGLLRANGGFQTNDHDMWDNYLYSIAGR